jgi:hypothetical protein
MTALTHLVHLAGQSIGAETLPTELGWLFDLFWLELSDNQLTGTLPPQSLGVVPKINDPLFYVALFLITLEIFYGRSVRRATRPQF